MADGDDKQARSADALEALAGDEVPDADAALEAVPAGPPVQVEDALANLADSDDPVPVEDDSAPPAGAVELDVAVSAVEAQSPRQAGGGGRMASGARARPVQLPKIMIPLLVVVGVLLLLFSAATLVLLLGARPDNLDVRMLRRYGPALVLVSCPLAAALLGGAWWVHRQIRRGRKDETPLTAAQET